MALILQGQCRPPRAMREHTTTATLPRGLPLAPPETWVSAAVQSCRSWPSHLGVRPAPLRVRSMAPKSSPVAIKGARNLRVTELIGSFPGFVKQKYDNYLLGIISTRIPLGLPPAQDTRSVCQFCVSRKMEGNLENFTHAEKSPNCDRSGLFCCQCRAKKLKGSVLHGAALGVSRATRELEPARSSYYHHDWRDSAKAIQRRANVPTHLEFRSLVGKLDRALPKSLLRPLS